MARVEIGLNRLSVNSARQGSPLVEDVGFDIVGITDGQMVWRDLCAALTLAAADINRIQLTLVPDHFVPRKAVVGTPDGWREPLDGLLQSAFTEMSLTPMGAVTKRLRTLGSRMPARLHRA